MFGRYPQGTNERILWSFFAVAHYQRLRGEDGGKLKVVVQVGANTIAEHYPNSCHNANPKIIIILWSLLGQNILHV